MVNLADIGKTFGPLPDRRTGNHMENPSFTGPPKLLQTPQKLLRFHWTGGPAKQLFHWVSLVLWSFHRPSQIDSLPVNQNSIGPEDRCGGTFTGSPAFSSDVDQGPIGFAEAAFTRPIFFFFNIRIPIEGLPIAIFLPDRRTSTIRVFIGPLELFSPVALRTDDRWISQCLIKI